LGSANSTSTNSLTWHNPPSDSFSDSDSPEHARWPDTNGRRALPEEDMMMIKIQYDAFNRTFKLVDSEFGTLLEGDALYDLAIPLVSDDGDEEFLAPTSTFVSHP
jgi:hypothetical protein